MDRGLDHWRTANETSLINGNRAWSWAKFTKYYNFKSISLSVCAFVSRICRTYSMDSSLTIKLQVWWMNWKNEEGKGNVGHWNLSRSLLFAGYGCLRTGSLVTELSRHNWSRVSLKGVHSRLMPGILVHLVETFVQNSGFFFFWEFLRSERKWRFYVTAISVRFSLSFFPFFFLCQVELHECVDFSNIFGRKEVSKSIIKFRCL